MQDPIRVLVRHADPLIAAGAAATLADQPGIVVPDARPDADVLIADYEGAIAWLGDAPSARTGVLVLSWRVGQLEARSRTEATAIAAQRGLLGPRLALAA